MYQKYQMHVFQKDLVKKKKGKRNSARNFCAVREQNTEKLPLQLPGNAPLSKVHRANKSNQPTEKSAYVTCTIGTVIL